jgi:tryptophan-rich sensory protein
VQTPKSGILGALIAILLPIIGGSLIGLITQQEATSWYPTLKKPAWSPPNQIFEPVRTILYALMGLASWLVWRKRGEQEAEVHSALNWYGRQLGLNFLWSLVFFTFHRPDLALLGMFPLIGSILNTTAKFSRVDRLAATLMIPYQLWVAFAAIVNTAIWWLNPKQS